MINDELFAILQKYDFSSKSQLPPCHDEQLFGCLRYCKSTIFQANHNACREVHPFHLLFAILQKYDFSSKSQRVSRRERKKNSCLRYCKSTIFQANHNSADPASIRQWVVCDTAKVRFFKQITTVNASIKASTQLFAILQKYDFSSKSQHLHQALTSPQSCLRYCKSTIFQANHNLPLVRPLRCLCCLRYCKSTIFQANHNYLGGMVYQPFVVCDTAKVRFFKQITTLCCMIIFLVCCLRYCKSTIFQANHNIMRLFSQRLLVVCDTAKVRFFKQITTLIIRVKILCLLFAILQKYDFSSKSQQVAYNFLRRFSCLRYCKSTIFQANHNRFERKC